MNQGPEAYIDDSRQLKDEDKFCFSCTADKPCFTNCCHDLNLVLMPYDIVRLKRRLGMSTTEFLKKYTSVHVGFGSGLPVVMLKMEGAYLKCPFLDEDKGCSVYEDRPGACRSYPLARLAQRSKDKEGVEEFYYIVREPDCKGFHDGKEWSVRDWKEHEGLEKYNEMNDLFGEILQAKTESGVSSLHADQIEIFYMGCYDIDAFRTFFLESPNLERYMESDETLRKIAEDEDELLRYAIGWVKRKLFSPGCLACGGSCSSS